MPPPGLRAAAAGTALAASLAAASPSPPPEWLRPVRETGLPGAPEAYASLSLDDTAVWLVEPAGGAVLRLRDGRVRRSALRCGGAAAAELGRAWWTARGSAALFSAGAELRTCDLATGRGAPFARLPAHPAVLQGYDGRAVAAAWVGARMNVVAGVARGGSRDDGVWSEGVDLASTEAELLERLPGSAAPSPFVSVTLSKGRLVVGSPRTFRLVVFDGAGRPARRLGRDVADTVAYSDAERRRILARAAAGGRVRELLRERLTRAKPFFRAETLAGDEEGWIWAGTAIGHPDSSQVTVFPPSGPHRTASVPGEVVRLAVHGRRLAVLSRRRGPGGERAVVAEYAITR